MGVAHKLTAKRKKDFARLIADGKTIHSVCASFGIATSTYRVARMRDPEFAKEVDAAKDIRTALVEDSLFVAAMKGNVLAQKFYLVNRSGGLWRELVSYSSLEPQMTQEQARAEAYLRLEELRRRREEPEAKEKKKGQV